MAATSTTPATMPGVAPATDAAGSLLCPSCGASTMTCRSTDSTPAADEGSTWLNHHLACGGCSTTHVLAFVPVFGRIVLRWLPQ